MYLLTKLVKPLAFKCPIAFTSRVLTPQETSYCITELECLAVVSAVQKFLPYIEHSHFTIETDHVALKNMLTMEEPSGRVRRWAMRLMGLDCTVVYRRGPTNLVADALSRAPQGADTETVERVVDDILPIQDLPEGSRLKFHTDLVYHQPTHTCKRCCPTPKQPCRIPRGPKIPQQQLISMCVFVEQERIPTLSSEWTRAQHMNDVTENLLDMVHKNDAQTMERGYNIDEDGILRKYNRRGDNPIVVPLHCRGAVIKSIHEQDPLHIQIKTTSRRLGISYTWLFQVLLSRAFQ